MPSLSGLDQDAALSALASVGVRPTDVETSLQPAATASGLVVGQTPRAGTSFESGSKVQLRVSSPANMPALVGTDQTAAQKALQELGAEVQVHSVFAAGRKPGIVLSTSPAPGAPLRDRAVLSVAQAPSSVFLSTLRPIDQSCETPDSASINGQAFENNLVCGASKDSPRIVEFTLNRRVATLSLQVGQLDRGPTGFVMRLRVLADGRQLSSTTVRYGSSSRVAVSVQGKLRLTFVIETLSEPAECCSTPELVMGGARLIGAPAAIDALVRETGNG
jgi:hypothetical protein